VEKRPAELALKHRRGMQREVEMTSLARYRYNLLGNEQVKGFPLKIGLTETTTMVGQNKSAQILIQYTDLEFDFKKIFGDVLEEVPELESVLRDGLRPLLSLIKGVTMLVNVNKDGRMTLAPNPFRFNQGLPIALMSQFNEQ